MSTKSTLFSPKWRASESVLQVFMLNLCDRVEYLDIEHWNLFDCNSRLGCSYRTRLNTKYEGVYSPLEWYSRQIPRVGSRQDIIDQLKP